MPSAVAFFKPDNDQIVFHEYLPHINAAISFRPLVLTEDLNILFGWVNQVYTRRFWQLNVGLSEFKDFYERVLENPNGHSFVGLVNDQLFCQVDVYRVQADELGTFIEATHNDCGLHLLMCPPKLMKRGWSLAALQCFQDFYFSHPEAGNLYAEPDHENHPANRLAVAAGFEFLRPIVLSYKTANLYMLTREKYQSLRNLS